MVVQVIY